MLVAELQQGSAASSMQQSSLRCCVTPLSWKRLVLADDADSDCGTRGDSGFQGIASGVIRFLRQRNTVDLRFNVRTGLTLFKIPQ